MTGSPSLMQRLGAAQKPAAAGSPAYSRFVNRRLGRRLAAAALLLGATPDQVTVLSAAATSLALTMIAVAPAGAGWALAITGCLVLGYALDSADGQLARALGRGRPAGEWLDHSIDAFKVVAIHLCVAIGWYHGLHRRGPILLAPLLFGLVAGGLFFVTWLTDRLRREQPSATPRRVPHGRAATLRSLALLPTDYGLLILLFACWGAPGAFTAGYLAALAATLGFAVLALPRWFRELDDLPGRA